MDTEGLLAIERDFGRGAAPRKLLTTKGITLKQLYESSKQ